MRVNKHEFYMSIAKTVSLASHAIRNQVGAVIEKDGNIIAFGYNGMPAGFDNNCEIPNEEGQMITNPQVLHAESNAIAKCAKFGISCEHATLYITTAPCFECAKLIIQSGINKVIYENEYRLQDGINLLMTAGVHVFYIHDTIFEK